MSFKLKLVLLGVLLASVIGYHHLSKKNAVRDALNAQTVLYESLMQEERIRAQETTNLLLTAMVEDMKEKDEEIQNITADRDDLLRRLSKRPSREDSSSASQDRNTCTGAELLREDGEFLAREAARADKILTERNYYYEQYERARRALASHQGADG